MVAYLPDYVVLQGQVIEDDFELNEIFQKMKRITKSEFLMEVATVVKKRFLQKSLEYKIYSLYEAAGVNTGEWNYIPFFTVDGDSRANVLNYMRGVIDGATYYK